ncbi:ABC transporter [Bradyrhizobium yuanmingense]|nr:ABC transporter [Bradyrhizobium yuanmingense]
MRGLDPRIHPLPNSLPSASMDCRVRPGNDGPSHPT